MPPPVDPRTPVIVGVAQQTQKPTDLTEALEAAALMQRSVEMAADDCGSTRLLQQLDVVAVVDGAWRYPDPGRLIADRIGALEARTILSYGGGNTPQSLVNELASRIQNGQIDSAVITGAETIWSRRRMRAAGIERQLTKQVDVDPDERFGTDIPMSTPFEAERGVELPINFYPIFESALQEASGRSMSEHRTYISKMWAGFNQVAVGNSNAWSRSPMTAEQIREPTPENRMVGFPYTKAMNSNWDLDQAAALLICSADAATANGISRDKWIFPCAGTDAHDTYAVSNRRDLFSSPAIAAAGTALFELTGTAANTIDHIDLYSCFPSAVQVAVNELGIDPHRQLTLTGGLSFAGGPLNNYVSHSIATMVETLRSDTGSIGLITANGGNLTKHAFGLYSTTPPAKGFRRRDVQASVDAVPSTSVDETFTGLGTIEAGTVMHDKAGPAKAIAAIRTPDGSRTWAFSPDLATMTAFMEHSPVGLETSVNQDGSFEVTSSG